MHRMARIFLLFVLLMAASTSWALETLRLDPSEDMKSLRPFLKINLANGSEVEPNWQPYQNLWQVSFVDNFVWLRFSVLNSANNPVNMVLTNEFRCAHVVVVNLDHASVPLYGGYRHFTSQLEPWFEPSFPVTVYPGVNTFYVGMNPEKNVNLAAMYLWSPKTFDKNLRMRTLATFFCAGGHSILIICACFIIFIYGIHQAFFLLVSLMGYLAFVSNVTGLIEIFGEQVSVMSQSLVLSSLAIATIFAMEFVCAFFDIKARVPSYIMKSIRFCGAIAFLSSLWCTIDGSAYALGLYSVLLGMLGITMVVINLAMLKVKGSYARLFLGVTTAFIPLGILVVFYTLGIDALELDYHYILIGCGVTSATAIFLILIHRVSADRVAKVQLQQGMMLGRSVQDLLLPHQFDHQTGNFTYQFIYHPFEGQMSGDWINYWQTSDGSYHLIIGDVIGKGPPAALAVASIATIVDRCVQRDVALYGCIEEINAGLFRLFKGKVQSSVSAATISAGGLVTLYNSGGVGWFIVRGNRALHQLNPARFLGAESDCHPGSSTFMLLAGDLIYSFTDGVCEGSKACRRLSQGILQVIAQTGDVVSYMKKVVVEKNAKDISDDRTMIILQSSISSAEAESDDGLDKAS